MIKVLENFRNCVPPIEAVRAQLVSSLGEAKYRKCLAGRLAGSRVEIAK